MAKDDQDGVGVPMTDLLQFILDMRSGQVAQDCNEKFNEVLTGVLETGAAGELTITLKIEPAKLGMGGCVLEVKASHKLKTKVPELEIGAAMFYVTKDGRLTRDDPAQTAMFAEPQPQEVKRGNRQS